MNKDPHNAWEAMRRLVGGLTGHWKTPTEMKELMMEDGRTAQSPADCATAISDHFSKHVFAIESSFDETAIASLADRAIDWSLNDPPSFTEMKTALMKMKDRKAPGPNGVSIEAIKALSDKQLHLVFELLNEVWDGK